MARAVSIDGEDGRAGPAPWGLFLELATFFFGLLLVLFHPGAGELVLEWPRLLLLSAPLLAALIAVERLLSRRLRARTVGCYPTFPSVLLVLLGIAVSVVGACNRLGPSSSRSFHPRFHGWISSDLPKAMPFRGPLPASAVDRAGREVWLAVVDSWEDEGMTFEVPLDRGEVAAAAAAQDPEVEIRIADGFLGVKYVAAVRLAAEE